METIEKQTTPVLYADAAVETLTIIANSAEEVRERIPEAFIDKLTAVSEHSAHRFTLDRTKSLAQQELLPETRTLLLMIYENFLETKCERSMHSLAEIEQFRNDKIRLYEKLISDGVDD